MTSTKQSQLSEHSKQIEKLKRRLAAWRKSHKPRTRLPNSIWNAAVKLAGQYGLNKTAKTLHLDYYDLKNRVDAATDNPKPVAAFIELSAPATSMPSECLIELESRSGAKMRIHLKGAALPDLNAFSSTFWRA